MTSNFALDLTDSLTPERLKDIREQSARAIMVNMDGNWSALGRRAPELIAEIERLQQALMHIAGFSNILSAKELGEAANLALAGKRYRVL